MHSKLIRLARSARVSAFTLVELLVSMSVITLVMLMLLSTVDQTQRIWRRTTNKVSQFQSARAAFEAMTRNLGQATLNTYYGVEFNTEGNPTGYHRRSDLHFVSGKAAQNKLLGGSAAEHPTHAVFFQAPIGITEKMTTTGTPVKLYSALNNLLSGVGYYIEWGDDKQVPEFLKTSQGGGLPLVPERYRFRLMEVIQPSESLSVYATPEVYGSSVPFAKTTDWIQTALGKLPPASGGVARSYSRARAENIIALVILPKVPERDRTPPGSDKLDLAKQYEYDTRPPKADGSAKIKEDLVGTEEKAQFHQLPPIVQIVMVAIDEPSAARQQLIGGEVPPDWTEGLFERCAKEGDLLKDLGDPVQPDSGSLLYRLAPPNDPSRRMEYRVYSADVILRGSKWTTIDEMKLQ